MAIRRILVDEGLLLELLFGRPLPLCQGDRLWDLFLQRQINGYVTDFALGQVGRYILRSHDPKITKTTLDQLCGLFNCCPIDQAMMHTAKASHLGLPFALQAAVVAQFGLDGIVTHRPLDYVTDTGEGEVPVYTPGHLLAEYATDYLEARRNRLETQYQDDATVNQRTWLGRIESVEVCCGQNLPTATVSVQTPLGYRYQETASGVGPVDAALRALNLAVNRYIPVAGVQMVYYRCLATTADSPVSAMVLLEHQMALFPGRGFHLDVVMASIDAYLDALGYLIFCDRLWRIASKKLPQKRVGSPTPYEICL
ncbi:hypothetical protein IQ273_11995 [Nodosilinea sp. LEGE 07298]|uniref:alpha-isopropylmalate synthase regulatory domain-containing protein n=1 Tax=Nodosilinea sp. LEGE 07298 TaxID=2777970 RepID=UPI00187EC342|nr:alpha-isopropylmalate synthase regulatory domain-containing protein [Nodosilinea sp. LEGE 07298]MBE9110132.1 hypothetical protein [Nodosilinea sp. LEGE 07298]